MVNRFDKREQLDKVICDFLDRGGPVEGLDESLSRMGSVDIDLLVECLNEMKHRMAKAAPSDVRAEAPPPRGDARVPFKIVA